MAFLLDHLSIFERRLESTIKKYQQYKRGFGRNIQFDSGTKTEGGFLNKIFLFFNHLALIVTVPSYIIKAKKVAERLFFSLKKSQKKCVNRDKKILRKKCVNYRRS